MPDGERHDSRVCDVGRWDCPACKKRRVFCYTHREDTSENQCVCPRGSRG